MGSPGTALKVPEFNQNQNGNTTENSILQSIQDLCRICGKSNHVNEPLVLIDVFSSEGEKNKLLTMLKFCFTPEVSPVFILFDLRSSTLSQWGEIISEGALLLLYTYQGRKKS